jgi:DNA-binding IclR family transcriptional regulator
VLLALAERGLVHRFADLRYSLGAACRALGDAAEAAGAPLIAIEPIAEALARATASCVAISSCVDNDTRVERVFDHAPAFAVRARLGESMALVPPFGAVFVAWDEHASECWLDRAGPALSEQERVHARAALGAVRARGYAISVTAVRPDFIQLVEDLADAPPNAAALRARDVLIREIAPSKYLPIEIPSDTPQHVNQMSAPIFDVAGGVPYSLMVLGPSYDLMPAEIDALGARLLAAAHDATTKLGGRQP